MPSPLAVQPCFSFFRHLSTFSSINPASKLRYIDPGYDLLVVHRNRLLLISLSTARIYRASFFFELPVLVVLHISSAYLTRSLPHMHPLLRGSIAESPKPKISASCPTTMRSKSTSPTPTPLIDVGTPAAFYMDSPQEVQEYLSRARAGLHKDRRVSHTLDWIRSQNLLLTVVGER